MKKNKYLIMLFLLKLEIIFGRKKLLSNPTKAKKRIQQAIGLALMLGKILYVIPILKKVPTTNLGDKERKATEIMLDRFSKSKFEFDSINYSDVNETVLKVLAIYQKYWFQVLMGKANDEDASQNLKHSLVEVSNEFQSISHSEISIILSEKFKELGYYSLFGRTPPYFELMIWKTQDEVEFIVELPEGSENVIVVMMDDFISLGWLAFATGDYHHTGGWVTSDKLFCVKSAYDLESEEFRVSYLVHEAQHFQDYRNFPEIQNSPHQLEYRAKLAEIIVGDANIISTLNAFEIFQSNNIKHPHPYSNRMVIKNIRKSLGEYNASWDRLNVIDIKDTARKLLAENTKELK